MTPTDRPPSVLVCRGCCCGTDKHPDVDHDGQEAALRAVAGRFYTPDCLGPCERSNVVVVRSGATRTWFGEILDDQHIAALATWIAGGADTAALPTSLAEHRFEPDEAGRSLGRRLDHTGMPLAELVGHLMSDPGCSWSIGHDGALAEVAADGASVHTGGSDWTRSLRVGAGRLRLTLSPDTAAFLVGDDGPLFLVLAVADHLSPNGPTGLQLLGLDTDAIDDEDRGATLVDLGLGRPTRFCIRTRDDLLLARLEALAGADWHEVLDTVGGLLVQRSPTRVVLSPIGRAEVDAPIPAPSGLSPVGAHTHLLADRLVLASPSTEQLALPPGWTAAASVWLQHATSDTTSMLTASSQKRTRSGA